MGITTHAAHFERLYQHKYQENSQLSREHLPKRTSYNEQKAWVSLAFINS